MGVLLPLLGSLVIDKILTAFDSQGYDEFGFADDIVIIMRLTNVSKQTLWREHSLKNSVLKGCKE
jgi:hypothetical protein